MKKKVLLVINTKFSNAGVPHVIMSIVKELSDEFTFDLLTYSDSELPGEREKEFLSYGGKIFRLKVNDYEKNKLLFFLRYFSISKCVKKLIINHKYDIIHCNNGVEAGVVLYTAALYKTPIRIAHAHGVYSRKGRNYILRICNYLNKWWINHYATSRVACSELAGQSLFSGKEFANILNPVDTAFYSKIQSNKHNTINLLQIGYFCHNKNQMMSLQVLKRAIDLGENVKLYFIGYIADERYYEEMREFIYDNGLEEYVFFLDKNADKRYYLSIADFLLLPSYSEGLSITTLEAQAAGINCVVSDSVSKDCDCGLVKFINNKNVEEWTSYITTKKNMQEKLNYEKMKRIDVVGYSEIIRDTYHSI